MRRLPITNAWFQGDGILHRGMPKAREDLMKQPCSELPFMIRQTAGNPADGPFFRSVHGLRHPYGRCEQKRAHEGEGLIGGLRDDQALCLGISTAPEPLGKFLGHSGPGLYGFLYGNPFIYVPPGERFFMTTMKFAHIVAAYFFTVSFLLRIYWGLVGTRMPGCDSMFHESDPVERYAGRSQILSFYKKRTQALHRPLPLGCPCISPPVRSPAC